MRSHAVLFKVHSGAAAYIDSCPQVTFGIWFSQSCCACGVFFYSIQTVSLASGLAYPGWIDPLVAAIPPRLSSQASTDRSNWDSNNCVRVGNPQRRKACPVCSDFQKREPPAPIHSHMQKCTLSLQRSKPLQKLKYKEKYC